MHTTATMRMTSLAASVCSARSSNPFHICSQPLGIAGGWSARGRSVKDNAVDAAAAFRLCSTAAAIACACMCVSVCSPCDTLAFCIPHHHPGRIYVCCGCIRLCRVSSIKLVSASLFKRPAASFPGCAYARLLAGCQAGRHQQVCLACFCRGCQVGEPLCTDLHPYMRAESDTSRFSNARSPKGQTVGVVDCVLRILVAGLRALCVRVLSADSSAVCLCGACGGGAD